MGTKCIPSKTLCPFSKGCKWAYLVFHGKRLEPSVAMATTQKMPFCSFVMYISDTKFEERCFNISRDLLDSVFYCQLVERFMTSSLSSFALYKSVNIPEQKKIF